MKFQEYVCQATKHASDEAFRYAKAVPADKVDWKPDNAGRSVLDQTRELAMAPVWAHLLVSGGDLPAHDEASMAEYQAMTSQWTTVEQCEAVCHENMAKLFDLYKTIPDEKLTDTKFLPFDGGRDFTWMEIMEYPRWNSTWHAGQIAYVQTLFGDKEMH